MPQCFWRVRSVLLEEPPLRSSVTLILLDDIACRLRWTIAAPGRAMRMSARCAHGTLMQLVRGCLKILSNPLVMLNALKYQDGVPSVPIARQSANICVVVRGKNCYTKSLL